VCVCVFSWNSCVTWFRIQIHPDYGKHIRPKSCCFFFSIGYAKTHSTQIMPTFLFFPPNHAICDKCGADGYTLHILLVLMPWRRSPLGRRRRTATARLKATGMNMFCWGELARGIEVSFSISRGSNQQQHTRSSSMTLANEAVPTKSKYYDRLQFYMEKREERRK